MSKLKTLIVLIVILAVGGGILFFRDNLLDIYSRLSLRLLKIETLAEKQISNLAKEAEKQISTPPPLRAEKETPESFLTKDGIVYWTNVQREKYGLPPLKENDKLNTAAKEKAEDMFENQYFAHQSPLGVGVGDLAEKAGYEFLAIGENLALGNFQNDQILVQAWMASPGHRENILSSQYQEIGVAVKKGFFEGKLTWLAIQHFGLPFSACPQPSPTLERAIEANQNQIKELQNSLEVLQFEIRTMRPKRGPDYVQKVEQYNNLVSQYNAFIDETEALIYEYNTEVKLFNRCVTGI